MSTLAACACVCRMCVSICVFVLAYCGLPRNIVSKFTNFLCIPCICAWWHASQPRSGLISRRTNKMNRFVWHYFVIQQPHLYAAMRAISVAHFRANFISVLLLRLLLQSSHNLPMFVAH